MKEEEFWNEVARSLEGIPLEVGIYEYHALKEIGDVCSKKVLDCGIGIGKSSVFLAQKGAEVFGFDISSQMVRVAKNRAKRVNVFRMRTECLGFKDEQFDAVFGIHILHHTNIKKSISEIYRVLKKGGKGVFVENFGFNPIVNFSRTHIVGKFGIPRHGTLEEHPLVSKDMRIINSYFRTKIITPDFLFAKLFAWKIFGFRYKLINSLCDLLDKWILKGFTGLSYYSYTQLLVIEKSL